MIQIASLVAAGIGPTQARLFEAALAAACTRFGIDTPLRQAAFVAQCAHESRLFTALEESLWYRSAERIRAIFRGSVPTLAIAQRLVGNPKALADHVYANRNGNRDDASGDGWRYRGRGLIQLTGRTNYTRAAGELGRPYVDQPDLVLEPADACLTAAWFWNARNLNALADASRIDDITRAINGNAMAGADERRRLFETALAAFALPKVAPRGRARSAPSTGTRRPGATPAAAETLPRERIEKRREPVPEAIEAVTARTKATRTQATEPKATRTKATRTKAARPTLAASKAAPTNGVRTKAKRAKAKAAPTKSTHASVAVQRNAPPRQRPRGAAKA